LPQEGAGRSPLLPFLLVLPLTWASLSEAQETPSSRWNVSIRGGYDPMDLRGQDNRGAVWGSARYEVTRWLSVMGEAGFSRYRYELEPEGWCVDCSYVDEEETTDLVPLSLGIRLQPANDSVSWPFLEILPTLFHSDHRRFTERGHFQAGGARLMEYQTRSSSQGWRAGLQLAAGFHLVTPPPGGLEFGMRGFLVTNPEYEYDLLVEGTPERNRFPHGVQKLFLFAGVSFDL